MNKDVYICFINYEKAFDRVNHKELVECLQKIEVKENDLQFIRNLYWNKRALNRMEKGLSDEIEIKREEFGKVATYLHVYSKSTHTSYLENRKLSRQ